MRTSAFDACGVLKRQLHAIQPIRLGKLPGKAHLTWGKAFLDAFQESAERAYYGIDENLDLMLGFDGFRNGF